METIAIVHQIDEIDETGARGSYLSINKGKDEAAGTVLIGQRVTIPQDVSKMELSVDYQCFCPLEERSGMVSLGVFRPDVWDKMPSDPMDVKGGANRGNIYNEWVKQQGPDQTEWARGSVDSAKLSAKLKRHAGKEVVVAVGFLPWHQTNKEYAKFDNLSLTPAK